MTVFASEHNARTFNFSAGDVGAVPFAYGHYIENTSSDSVYSCILVRIRVGWFKSKSHDVQGPMMRHRTPRSDGAARPPAN
jgi:hypothetical protein